MNDKLRLMYNQSIPINVLTLCLGFKYEDVSFGEFKDYSLFNYLSEKDVKDFIGKGLLDPRDSIDLEAKIAKILTSVDAETLNFETEKWLFVELKHLRNCVLEREELLDKIAELYAKFGYPPSMEHIVNYMPSTVDLSAYTVEQAQARLVDLCDVFLITLENELKQQG